MNKTNTVHEQKHMCFRPLGSSPRYLYIQDTPLFFNPKGQLFFKKIQKCPIYALYTTLIKLTQPRASEYYV